MKLCLTHLLLLNGPEKAQSLASNDLGKGLGSIYGLKRGDLLQLMVLERGYLWMVLESMDRLKR